MTKRCVLLFSGIFTAFVFLLQGCLNTSSNNPLPEQPNIPAYVGSWQLTGSALNGFNLPTGCTSIQKQLSINAEGNGYFFVKSCDNIFCAGGNGSSSWLTIAFTSDESASTPGEILFSIPNVANACDLCGTVGSLSQTNAQLQTFGITLASTFSATFTVSIDNNTLTLAYPVNGSLPAYTEIYSRISSIQA